jgi:hypothetical protein
MSGAPQVEVRRDSGEGQKPLTLQAHVLSGSANLIAGRVWPRPSKYGALLSGVWE